MRFVLLAFAASVALGQTNRVFQLTQNESPQQLEQIATVLRATADIPGVSFDPARTTLTVEGSPAQIAMADWLVHQMDLPANAPLSGVHEYRPPTGGDDLVRVFYLAHAATPQQLQEIVMTLRAVADVPRLFVYTTLGAVAARGTGQQIALAAWLVNELDQPANAAAPAPQEYKLPGDDVARVFELTYPQTPQQLQEIATLIRSIADTGKLYVCQGRRAVTVRAPAQRVALAAWLVSELDKPVTGQASAQDRTAPHEFHLANDPDNLVRIFFLAGPRSAEDYQKVAVQVRMTARIPRLFVYNALGALAARGTVGQVATAERVIEEMKAQ